MTINLRPMLNFKSILFSFILLTFTTQIMFAQNNAIAESEGNIKGHENNISNSEANIKSSEEKIAEYEQNILILKSNKSYYDKDIKLKELKLNEIKEKMEAEQDFDKIVVLGDKIDALQKAISSLKLEKQERINTELMKIVVEQDKINADGLKTIKVNEEGIKGLREVLKELNN